MNWVCKRIEIVLANHRTRNGHMRCRDPAGQSEFFVRVSRLKTFSWIYCYKELIVTEVDGPSAERSETAQARPRPRTQPRSVEEGNHGDRPCTGISKVSKGEQRVNSQYRCLSHSRFQTGWQYFVWQSSRLDRFFTDLFTNSIRLQTPGYLNWESAILPLS